MSKKVSIAVTVIAAVFFAAWAGGSHILRWYVSVGIGSCDTIPILCMTPQQALSGEEADPAYRSSLIQYRFPKLSIALPKGFTVVQETIKKVYYKKHRRLDKGSTVYLLYEPPGFFINLFPQVRREGIRDNYEFIRRLMYASFARIQNVRDAFFVVIKSIFIPDLGDQKEVKMVVLSLGKKRGFLNYNLAKEGNYFECNLVDEKDNFFKVYIKDKGRELDLRKVLTILNSLDI